MQILRRLIAAGANVTAYDPTVSEKLADYPDVEIASDPYAAVEGATVLAVLTEWDEFKWLDLDKVADAMAERRARRLQSLDRHALRVRYQGSTKLMAHVVTGERVPRIAHL